MIKKIFVNMLISSMALFGGDTLFVNIGASFVGYGTSIDIVKSKVYSNNYTIDIVSGVNYVSYDDSFAYTVDIGKDLDKGTSVFVRATRGGDYEGYSILMKHSNKYSYIMGGYQYEEKDGVSFDGGVIGGGIQYNGVFLDTTFNVESGNYTATLGYRYNI